MRIHVHTFKADDFCVFGDGMDMTSNYVSRISVQSIRLIVIAAKNVVERIATEAGQHHLPTISFVVLLINVIPGHDSNSLRSTRPIEFS